MSGKIKIYNPITEKETKIDPYGRTAKKIYKYMIDAGSDPDTILPDNLTYNNNRFVRVKPIEDVSNVRRITYAKVKASTTDTDTMSYFRNIMKSYKGQTIKVVKRYSKTDVDYDFDTESTTFNIIGTVQVSDVFVVPQTGFSSWWDKNSIFFWIDSEEHVFGNYNDVIDDPKLQAQLLILTLDKVDKEDINQYFLDGITNCFFTPIKDWANYCEENSKSKTAQKRYKTINKKVDKYIEKYSKGIPEEDMSTVCNDLQISVEIDLPSTMHGNKTKFIEVESQKKALKKFRYVNTRLNHIELNSVNSKDNYEEVDKNTINTIYKDAKENKDFILWKESNEGVTQINTLTNIYKLKDEDGFAEIATEFDEDYNMKAYKIDKLVNPELSDFLDYALHTNQSITFVPDCVDEETAYNWFSDDESREEPQKLRDGYYKLMDPDIVKEKLKGYEWLEDCENLNHIDIRKAYANGHKCSQYQGYLGKITDFRKTDKIVGLGIYRVKNIRFNGCEAIKKMKCFHEGNPYPSPELEYYRGLGITFDIDMGCWGSTLDFNFEGHPRMFEKNNGVSHYCKWYGCLMKITEKERYNFTCDKIEFAKLNAYNNDECDIRYNYDEDGGIIEYEKKTQYHSFHIAAFISSYARISMMEQINKFTDFEQIVSVVVDGIYYKGDVEVGDLFADKEQKSLRHSLNNDMYLGDDVMDTSDYNLSEFRENNDFELHLGAGGCGKTHLNLTDKGFQNVLFVAPSWKLARNKEKEYGVHSTTFFHTIDKDPDKWRPLYNNYSVLVVDEISMLSDQAKEDMIERFDQHKIIFCGDLGYQLPPIDGEEFKINKLPVFKHTTNYRCKCDKLEKRLLWLRSMIDKGTEQVGGVSIDKMIKAMNMEVVSSDTIDYSVEDLILCATHEKKDTYTEKYKHLEKYSVKKNTRDYCNGQIIIGPKPKKVSCELRHAFTIHAIQGETASHKLFIEVNKMKSVKMVYTAMSRAKYLDQIVFIKS